MSRFLRCLLAVLVCLALCIPVLMNPVLADEETTAEPTEEDNTEDVLTPAVEEAEELLPVIEETEEVNEVSEESGSIDPEVEHDLQEDEYYHGEIDFGQTLWFSFTPTMSDSYDFHFDVFPGATVTLYDQDDEQVATVYHDSCIAEMTAELSAEVIYYIEVTNSDDSSGSYNINVRRTPAITVEAVGDTDFEVNYGSPVRLEVNASSRLGTELTYFWSSSDSGIVPEECNSNVLEIDEITKTTWFYCTVSDEYNNYVSESFVVRTNRFSATADSPATQYVAAGSSADLKVKLSGDDLSKVEYSWYFREFESEDDWPDYTYMEEADQNTIHIDNIQKRQEYFCDIRDGYGNTTSVYFYSNSKQFWP